MFRETTHHSPRNKRSAGAKTRSNTLFTAANITANSSNFGCVCGIRSFFWALLLICLFDLFPKWGAMWRDGSEWSEKTKKMALENMHEHIKDPKLREILTPDFPPWSRRLLVSSKFYPALMRDNVTLCQERILEVTKNAVVSSSEDPRTAAVLPGRPIPPPDPNAEKIVREVDVIIYATGWAQGIDAMKRGFTIFGRGGKTLGQHFFEMGEPKNYMGQMFDGFPNYFTLAGAGALPADTFQRAGEIGMGWFLQLLDRVRNENLASFEVTPEAVKQWDDMVANLSQGMAMLTPGVKS